MPLLRTCTGFIDVYLLFCCVHWYIHFLIHHSRHLCHFLTFYVPFITHFTFGISFHCYIDIPIPFHSCRIVYLPSPTIPFHSIFPDVDDCWFSTVSILMIVHCSVSDSLHCLCSLFVLSICYYCYFHCCYIVDSFHLTHFRLLSIIIVWWFVLYWWSLLMMMTTIVDSMTIDYSISDTLRWHLRPYWYSLLMIFICRYTIPLAILFVFRVHILDVDIRRYYLFISLFRPDYDTLFQYCYFVWLLILWYSIPFVDVLVPGDRFQLSIIDGIRCYLLLHSHCCSYLCVNVSCSNVTDIPWLIHLVVVILLIFTILHWRVTPYLPLFITYVVFVIRQ